MSFFNIILGPAKSAEGALKDKLRPFNLSLQFNTREDLDLDHVCQEVQRLVVTDGDADKDDYSAAALMAAVEEEVKAHQQSASAGGGGGGGGGGGAVSSKSNEKLSVEHQQVQGAVQAVRSGDSRTTWCLMTPNFD